MSEHHGEKRQIGALAFMTRQPQPGNVASTEVLVIADEAKQEASAGFLSWRGRDTQAGTTRVMGLPGGGRAPAETGREETLWETLVRELLEEVNFSFTASMLQAAAEQQPSPFGVIQQKRPKAESDSLPPMHLFAVTAVWLAVDKLPLTAQEHLDGLAETGLAQWVPVAELAFLAEFAAQYWSDELGSKVVAKQPNFDKIQYRPQVLTTAWVWWLSRVGEEPVQQVAAHTQQLNERLYSFVQDNLQPHQALSNGTFTESGRIFAPDQLGASDREFLYPAPAVVVAETEAEIAKAPTKRMPTFQELLVSNFPLLPSGPTRNWPQLPSGPVPNWPKLPAGIELNAPQLPSGEVPVPQPTLTPANLESTTSPVPVPQPSTKYFAATQPVVTANYL